MAFTETLQGVVPVGVRTYVRFIDDTTGTLRVKPDIREQLQRDLGPAFLLGQELGGGGMSRVFLATEQSLGRAVVVKVLPPELGGEVSVERFRREVTLTARLQHPNIVPVLNAGEGHTPDGGKALLYYTMPFVNGESLRSRLERVGEFPIADAVSIIRDVSRALAFAHSHGIIHRDLKPENILLAGEAATVTDFGIAKALERSESEPQTGTRARINAKPLTSVGLAVGTPAYMAPEQIAVDPAADHRTDLYALGVVAYEILAGAHPFAGRRAVALLAAHATEIPESLAKRRAGIPTALATLVMGLLEKQPDARPQSANAVLRSLDAIVTGQLPISRPTIPVVPIAPIAPVKKPSRRPAILGAVAVIALIVAALAYLMFARRREPVGAAGANPPTDPVAATRTPTSVAVLPLATVGDSTNPVFVEGVTAALISALDTVPGLRVTPRTSVLALEGTQLSARQIGDTLKVASVLRGSVQRDGNRVVVDVRLINTALDSIIWATTIDVDQSQIVAVQDSIARAVVATLQVRPPTGAIRAP